MEEMKKERIMDKKALFFDVDGTLLSEITGRVPESTFKALEEAGKLGHLTFINTGRTIASLPEMFKSMPFSGLLCGCGTYIQYGEEILASSCIPYERGREIIQLIKDCNGDMLLEGSEDCYLTRYQSRFEKIEMSKDHLKKRGLGITSYIEDGDFNFDKLVFCVDDWTDLPRLMKGLEVDMEVMDRQGGLYEVVPKGYSKAGAIAYILKYFNMSLEDAYVFGDSSNDLSMFQYVKHAVAMERHDSVLDPYTEFITRSVEEDGIFHAMKHYGII